MVHFPAGSYQLDKTLVIPPNCDVQLVGDGAYPATRLAGASPTVRIDGPSHATVREIALDGLLITNCDQPGARIFGEEMNVGGAKEVGLLADGLEHARVLLHDFNHGIQPAGREGCRRHAGRAGSRRKHAWRFSAARPRRIS